MMGGPEIQSWHECAFLLAAKLNALEDAVRWYVEHVKWLEGRDYLEDRALWRIPLAQIEAKMFEHAKLLRRYRKDFDENRDDN